MDEPCSKQASYPLGMIADVHSSDRAAEAKAKAVKVTSFSGEGSAFY